MSLLFDANISWRLIRRLADLYPRSNHVRSIGMEQAWDEAIWDRAKADGLAIVSKDDDFRQRALVFGAPPKTIWLRLGNASTDAIEQELRRRNADVRVFLVKPVEAMLILGT